MALKDHMKKLLDELEAPEVGNEKLQGLWEFTPEDELNISLDGMKDKDWILISYKISTPPQTLGQYEDVMRANLFGEGTFDATLCFDPAGKIFFLQRSLPQDCDYYDFRDAIEDFVNAASFWKEHVLEWGASKSLKDLAKQKQEWT